MPKMPKTCQAGPNNAQPPPFVRKYDWTDLCGRVERLVRSVNELKELLHYFPDPKFGDNVNTHCRQIQDAVARYFGAPVEIMWTKSRHKYASWIRYVAMALIRDFVPMSSNEIGSYFAGKDHGTVLYGIRRIREMVHLSPRDRYAQAYLHLHQSIEQGLCQINNNLISNPAPTPSPSSAGSSDTLAACEPTATDPTPDNTSKSKLAIAKTSPTANHLSRNSRSCIGIAMPARS